MPRVVTQILQAHWDEAASMAVMEFKLGCGEFKVTSAEYGATADEGEHDIVLLVAHGSPMHQQSLLCNGVLPVSLDGIKKYDGVTKPPLVTSRQSGRPKKDKKTKRVPGCRGFTDRLFKLWLQRS